jgi:hypothetical protein
MTKVATTLTNFREGATIFSLCALPLVVAWMQYNAAQKAVHQQYVAMAVGLLQKPLPKNKDDSDTDLRRWAVDIVNDSAPRPLPDSIKTRLATGQLDWSTFYFEPRADLRFVPAIPAPRQDDIDPGIVIPKKDSQTPQGK